MRSNRFGIKSGTATGKIRHKIAVLSGKGGVGKSTIAVNLAVSFASSGKKTGLLDVDIHGPSIPSLLGLEGETIQIENNRMVPVEKNGLKVMSIGFLTPEDGTPLILRGPMKANLIRQFIEDVEWGDLDYLIIDCPPGTGDEPLSVVQLLGDAQGAVIVTTPQNLAIIDVRKSINFCRQLDMPILGIVENMSGFVCPDCGKRFEIFKSGGGKKLAEEMDVPFLGTIPIDPETVKSGDEGRPLVKFSINSPASKAVMETLSKIYVNLEERTVEAVTA